MCYLWCATSPSQQWDCTWSDPSDFSSTARNFVDAVSMNELQVVTSKLIISCSRRTQLSVPYSWLVVGWCCIPPGKTNPRHILLALTRKNQAMVGSSSKFAARQHPSSSSHIIPPPPFGVTASSFVNTLVHLCRRIHFSSTTPGSYCRYWRNLANPIAHHVSPRRARLLLFSTPHVSPPRSSACSTWTLSTRNPATGHRLRLRPLLREIQKDASQEARR